jgi:hypothetical protein
VEAYPGSTTSAPAHEVYLEGRHHLAEMNQGLASQPGFRTRGRGRSSVRMTWAGLRMLPTFSPGGAASRPENRPGGDVRLPRKRSRSRPSSPRATTLSASCTSITTTTSSRPKHDSAGRSRFSRGSR